MRKGIALFIVIFVFIPTALGALYLGSINTWVLDRSVYTNLVRDERLFELMISSTFEEALQTSYVADGSARTAISEDAVQNMVISFGDLISPRYLQDESTALVNSFFDFAEGTTDDLRLSMNMVPLRDSILSPAGEQFVTAYLDVLDACQPGQPYIRAESILPDCLPQDGTTIEQIRTETLTDMRSWAAALPDEYVILDSLQSEIGISTINEDFNLREGLTWGLLSMLMVAAVMWLVLALIASDTGRGRWQWMGWSLLVPAILVVLSGIILINVQTMTFAFIQTTDASSSELIRELLGELMARIGTGFATIGVLAMVISVALIALGRIQTVTARRLDAFDRSQIV